MSDTISIHQFRSAVHWDKGNEQLRISKHTGEVVTRPHGLLSRLVRFINGPTDKDFNNNARIRENFIKGMKDEFGPELAKEALLHANLLFKGNEGKLSYHTHRELTSASVKQALSYASAHANEAWSKAANEKLAVMRDALDDGGLGASGSDVGSSSGSSSSSSVGGSSSAGSSAPPTSYARLEYDLVALQAQDDLLSDRRPDIDKHVGKLEKQTSEASTEALRTVVGDYGRLRSIVSDLAQLLAKPFEDDSELEDAMRLLAELRTVNDRISASGVLANPDEMGPEDMRTVARAATNAFAQSLSPDEAGRLATAMGHPDSIVSVLWNAFGSSERALGGMSNEATVSGYTTHLFRDIVGQVDRRAQETEEPPEPASDTLDRRSAERLQEEVEPPHAQIDLVRGLIMEDATATAAQWKKEGRFDKEVG